MRGFALSNTCCPSSIRLACHRLGGTKVKCRLRYFALRARAPLRTNASASGHVVLASDTDFALIKQNP